MGVVGLAGAVADPDHVARRVVPVARRGIDAGHRLLEAEQQRLVRGVEIGHAHLRMDLRVDADGAHEVEGLGDAVRDLAVSRRLLGVLHESQRPRMGVLEVRVAAVGEGADQVQGRGRLAVGLDLAARVRNAGFRRELDVVDDVAAVARQLHPVEGFRIGRAGLGELARDPADLHHGRAAREGENHRHLEEQAEEIADVVGGMLGEALGAIAALEQESLAFGHLGERALQLARLACKNERRKAGELLLDAFERLRVRKSRHLLNGLAPPAIGRPPLGHGFLVSWSASVASSRSSGLTGGRSIHEALREGETVVCRMERRWRLPPSPG
jgi:hypothetical protein